MSWLTRLFSRRRRYDDLTVSISEHIAERADELMDDGMPRAQAEQTARREFGNLALIEQSSREVWQWPTVESFLADVRFALRQLIKSPGFTVTTVATLALGIAVNATMFSLVSAFLLPQLPGRDPKTWWSSPPSTQTHPFRQTPIPSLRPTTLHGEMTRGSSPQLRRRTNISPAACRNRHSSRKRLPMRPFRRTTSQSSASHRSLDGRSSRAKMSQGMTMCSSSAMACGSAVSVRILRSWDDRCA